jgi:hypothetical protein
MLLAGSLAAPPASAQLTRAAQAKIAWENEQLAEFSKALDASSIAPASRTR